MNGGSREHAVALAGGATGQACMATPTQVRQRGASYYDDDDDVHDDSHSSRVAYADILARRLVFSRVHTAVCATMLVAGVVEVLWILLTAISGSGGGGLPTHPLFIFIESYVTLGLLGEILLRVAMQRREFCRKSTNVFDVVVATVSVASSALFYAGMETPAEMLLGTIIIISRIVFRLMRLVSVSRGFRQTQLAADRKLDIDLDSAGDVEAAG